MLRQLKQMLFWGLLLAAGAVAVATGLSDHADDYGTVTLPPGGAVELPEGTVKVFYDDGTDAAAGPQLAVPLAFQVVPAGGGTPVTTESTRGDDSNQVDRRGSSDVINRGSVAKLDVPEAGGYVVTGGNRLAPAELSFGTDPFTAIQRRWRLLADLLAGALIVALLPVPRSRRSADAAWA